MRVGAPPLLGLPTVALRRERAAAIGFVAVLAAIVIASIPARRVPLGVLPNFFAFYGTLLLITELATAALLAWRAHTSGDRRIAILAGAYVFSVPLIAGNVLTLPGVIAPAGTFGFQTPPWMWVCWHVGWAAIVALYAWREPVSRMRGRVRVAIALGAGLVSLAIVATGRAALPPLLRPDNTFEPLLFAWYGLALALQAVALAGLARRWRRATSLDVWVVVALVAAAGDVAMVMLSDVRFALGTYVARGMAATSGLVVLGSLIGEYTWAVRRSDTVGRYVALAEASPNLVYLTDRTGACTYVNARWTEVTGQPQSAALGTGWLAMVHPDDVVMRTDGTPYQIELRFRAADGSYRWHILRAASIAGDGGAPVAFIGTAVDIHDQRVAYDAARERETAFRAMAAAIPQLVWTAQADGAVDWYNDRWYAYTGQTPQEAAGWGWQSVHHPVDVLRVMDRWPHAIASGEPFEMEFRLRGADGTFRWFLTRAVPIRDEAGRIVRWYGTNTDVDDRRRATDRLAELYERERHVASTLQAAFLPPFLPDVDGVRFDALYAPASRESEVGGDWYDAFPLRDGRVAISVGDVVGHGLDAASAMVRIRETIRAAAASLESDPRAVLAFANRAVVAREDGGIATAVFGVYDPGSGAFAYSIAGHPAPIVRRRTAGVEVLPLGGVPLGVESVGAFPAYVVTLEPGDVLVLYTDGLIETTRDPIAGERRVRDALAQPLRDAADIVEAVIDGAPLNDDIALLTLSVATSAADADWRFRTDDAESARLARSSFVAHLRRRGIDDGTLASAELVFGELVGNVVRHAPGPIDIEVTGGQRVTLAVRDRGPGFTPTVGGGLPEDILSESGRGLFLVRAYVGEPVVLPRPGGGSEVIVDLVTAPEAVAS